MGNSIQGPVSAPTGSTPPQPDPKPLLTPTPPARPIDDQSTGRPWLLAVKMAGHDLRRHKTRTTLTLLLVMIPAMLVMGLATYWESSDMSPGLPFGSSELVVEPHDGFASTITSDSQEVGNSNTASPNRSDAAQRFAVLTDATNARWVPVATTRVTTTDAAPEQQASIVHVDPALGTAGRAFLTSGVWPSAPNELLVTPDSEGLGLSPGDSITMVSNGTRTDYTIVGTGYGSNDHSPASFVGFLDLGVHHAMGMYWLLHPDEQCTPEMVNQVRKNVSPSKVRTGHCGLSERQGATHMRSSNFDLISDTNQRESMPQLVSGYIPFAFAGCLLFMIVIAPSFSLSLTAQERYLDRLAQNGATKSQLLTIVITQSACVGFLGCLLGIGAGIAVAAAGIGYLRQPHVGNWNLHLSVSAVPAVLLLLAVLVSCAFSTWAVWTQTNAAKLSPRKLAVISMLLVVALWLVTALWCGKDVWSIDESLLLADHMVCGGLITAAAVVGLSWLIGWLLGRWRGNHLAHHQMILTKRSMHTLVFAVLASFGATLIGLMPWSVVHEQSYSSAPSLLSDEGAVHFVPADQDPAGITPDQAISIVQQHIPGAQLTPVTVQQLSPTGETTLITVGIGDCELQLHQTMAQGGPQLVNCTLAGDESTSTPVYFMTPPQAQARYGLTDDAAQRFADGSGLLVDHYEGHRTGRVYVGQHSADEPMDERYTPTRSRDIELIPVGTQGITGHVVLPTMVADQENVPLRTDRLAIQHPGRQLGQQDAVALSKHGRQVSLELPQPHPFQNWSWHITAGVIAALVAIMSIIATLHRRHHQRSLASLIDLGGTRWHVAGLTACFAATCTAAGSAMAVAFSYFSITNTYSRFPSVLENELAASVFPVMSVSPTPTALWQVAATAATPPALVAIIVYLLTMRSLRHSNA